MKLQLTRAVQWSYECLPFTARCRIDGLPLRVLLRLEGTTDQPPNVLEVEEWLQSLASEPTTVEEVAVRASAAWGLTATAVGSTSNHGDIVARCEAP